MIKVRILRSEIPVRTCRAGRRGALQGTFIDEITEIPLYIKSRYYYFIKNT